MKYTLQRLSLAYFYFISFASSVPLAGSLTFDEASDLAQSKASSSCTLTTCASPSTVLLHDSLWRLWGCLPATFKLVTLLRGSLSCLLLMCPYHHNRLPLTTCWSGSTPHLSATSPLLSQSCQETPAMYQSILRPHLVNMARILSVIDKRLSSYFKTQVTTARESCYNE